MHTRKLLLLGLSFIWIGITLAGGPVPGHYSMKVEKEWGKDPKGVNPDGSVPQILLTYHSSEHVKLTLINWGEFDKIYEENAIVSDEGNGNYLIQIREGAFPMTTFSYNSSRQSITLSIVLSEPREFELVNPIMEIRPGIYRGNSPGRTLILANGNDDINFHFFQKSESFFEEFSISVPKSFKIEHPEEDWAQIFEDGYLVIEYGVYSGMIKVSKGDEFHLFSWNSVNPK